MGDKQPTNEIHLDPKGIEEFRQQYVEAISYAKDSHLGCRAFTSMWEACFVFVKICELKAANCKYIRSYDNVDFYFILFFRSLIHGLYWAMQGDHLESCTYKINACTSSYSVHGWEEVIRHRSVHAINDPANKVSLISDGIAQHNCALPHRGQKSGFHPHRRGLNTSLRCLVLCLLELLVGTITIYSSRLLVGHTP